jgi:hypothetical protein
MSYTKTSFNFGMYICLVRFFAVLSYQGKDIVFRFIIEYNRLVYFGPKVIALFLYEDFKKDDILDCVETGD